MSSTLDRLRRLHSLREQHTGPDPETPFSLHSGSRLTASPARLETLVPGEEIENSGGTCYLSTHAYPLHQTRGAAMLGSLLDLYPSVFTPFHPTFGLDAAPNYQSAAFIDTETTGLGTGAGIYCFMVGVGTFEKPANVAQALAEPALQHAQDDVSHFVVRQLFMRNPAEEKALLMALAELLMDRGMTITFNGRTFDLPLLRARYSQNRRFLPATHRSVPLLREDAPHLDLLHPARRLWRRRLQSCRLINLEQKILGLERSEEDVPGQLIPLLYTQYLQSGDARAMSRVFYHNGEDIVSMVALAERLSRILGELPEDLPGAGLHGLEWLALGRAYENLSRPDQAEPAYRRALDILRNPADRADAFARLGALQKRQGRWQEATETWQLWLTSVSGLDPTPYIELAKYCEWQLNDLEQAEMWTAWALHNLRAGPALAQWAEPMRELEHRLQRLQRKRSTGMADLHDQEE